MNKQTEALLMAIDFLDGSYEAHKVRKACQEALEQPAMTYEQGFAHGYEAHKAEQLAYETESWKNNMKEAEKILAKAKFANEQPAQEPVAWIFEDELPDNYPYDAMFRYSAVIDGVRMFPVFYPAPSWVGLSDDEISKVISDEQIPVRTGKTANRFARAIEKELRNKIE